ncbi:MAG: hypothetical protein K6F25_07910 [Bacteroidales bacterium]|nr:hypothetical protein [Bacteroidales bacterium]
MKKIINIFSIIALSLLAFSCNIENSEGPGSRVHPGEPAHIKIPFYSGAGTNVDIKTKVSLGEDYEGKIYNLYVAIYNSEGELQYNMFYDLYTDGWSYTQNGTTSQGQGEVELSTYQGEDCSIYMVANISTAMYNLNADKLKIVGTTEAALRAMVAKLNQNIVSRDGFFLMTGWLKHVDIAEQQIISNENTVNSDGQTGTGTDLHLDRLDAKVTFNFTCAAPDDPTTHPTIESFSPTVWYVVNVPRRAYLMDVASNNSNYFGSDPDNYFESDHYRIFHTTTATSAGAYDTHTFSFYVTETNLEAKNPITSYAERERQEKDANGYNGDFVNAPDYATYVVVEGDLTMLETDYDPVTGVLVKRGRTLSADVKYKIHLGDLATSMSDFSALRNHSYTYNVTLKGVDNITIEVITSDNSKIAGGTPDDAVENDPGATGEVTLALEKFVNVDAHYASFVHSFAANNINDALTWYVKTPFSKGAAITNPADYKWIKFRINELGSNGKYKLNRRLFKPLTEPVTFDATAIYNGAEGSATESPTMTVKELTDYLITQRHLKDAGATNAFDSDGNLAITFFVDENYYEADPRDGTVSGELWKKFTGITVEPRIMHILSKTMESYDEESYVIASTISVKQKTIQTMYSTSSDISRAWGCEHEDEGTIGPRVGWRGNYGTTDGNTRSSQATYNQNNLGRLNNLKEWGVYNGSTWNENLNWSTYVNLTSDDATLYVTPLQSGYNYVAYQCMSRNRDNDGDGKIDRDEVRWYLASHKQINALWTGDMSIVTSARYYIKPASTIYLHYATSSSMATSSATGLSTQPLIVWAEEFGATGRMGADISGGRGGEKYYVRCVRDFNTDLTGNPAADAANPEDFIKVTGSNDGGWTFDLSALASENFRESRDAELIYGMDDNPANNRVSVSFVTAPVGSHPKYPKTTFQDLNNDERVGIGRQNPYCPEGYRLPNNRELTIMYSYLPQTFWTTGTVPDSGSGFISRTAWSLGRLGSNPDEIRLTIGVVYGGANMSTQIDGEAAYNAKSTVSRCVKDVYEVSIDD